MRLPPLTFTEAANLYQNIVGTDGDCLLVEPAEQLMYLASALVVFGRQLEKDQAAILERNGIIEELNAHLRTLIDEARVRALEADTSDLPERYEVPSEMTQVRTEDPRFQDGQITAVEWRGPGRNYFDNFEAINKELAQGISKMAQQQIDAAPDGYTPTGLDGTVIDTTEGSEDPK